MDIVGQIICGEYGDILVRQKSSESIELGDLLVVENDASSYMIVQAYNLAYSSQMTQNSLELMSGIHLEGLGGGEFMEKELRSYVIASVKALVQVRRQADGGMTVTAPKVLPSFFTTVRKITDEDLAFLEKPKNPLFLGMIRSGSKLMNIPVAINGEDAFTHHIMIPATTGRGKSNLVKVMLWNLVSETYCGLLILDPHDEYYGRTKQGLKDHPQAQNNVIYYSPRPPRGGMTLRINIRLLRPWHFNGIASFSEQQEQAMHVFYNLYRDEWLRTLLQFTDKMADGDRFHGVALSTIVVLQRKLGLMVGMQLENSTLISRSSSIFTADEKAGETTVADVLNHLEAGKKVIVDTSNMGSTAELIIGSMLSGDIFERYRRYKGTGELDTRPVVSVILEEAPRVLATGNADNIFKTIAKEGRKFKIGITAITQLSSIIPKEILANMNTKIILGNEMAQEREAIIGSAAQDLSTDGKMIAALDKGEAIISSIFTRFAAPVQIPLFEDYIKKDLAKKPEKKQARIGIVA